MLAAESLPSHHGIIQAHTMASLCHRCRWRRKFMECIDAAPAAFLAATFPTADPHAAAHRKLTHRDAAQPPLNLPNVSCPQSEPRSAHSLPDAGMTPDPCQQQTSMSPAAGVPQLPTGQPATLSTCYTCSHGGDVLCMDLPSGALVWERLLPGRTAPGLCLHPQLKAGPPACRRGCAGASSDNAAPSRLAVHGRKSSS